VGGLNNRTNERDVAAAFSKCGRIREIAMKTGFCFVEFEDTYDAAAAVRRMNGSEICGSRVRVQHSRARGAGPTPGEGKCYNCGKDGHWARECPDGDMSDKCYLCGDSGHMQRDCKSKGARRRRSRSPRSGSKEKRSRSRSKSRSPVPEVPKNGDVAVDVEGRSEDVELADTPKEDKPNTAAEAVEVSETREEVQPEERVSE
jgi:arginine/serine-rich splicing factor 7